MITASGLLAVIIGGTFALLLFAIDDLRDAERRTEHAQDVLVAANLLERLVLDLETGQRGFVLTGKEHFLEPWDAARVKFPDRAAALRALVDAEPDVEAEAGQIAERGRAYIRDYSIPLVTAARHGDAWASSEAATAEGKRRVDAIRADFDRLIDIERRIDADAKAGAESATRRATWVAVVGVAGSLVLVALFTGYLARGLLWPVRRAAAMADRFAGGDLSARMPETGPGEIGALGRAFNLMGSSLRRRTDELAVLAAEQGALRRVATLVAEGAPPAQVFAAVADELGQVLGADVAQVLRYESDGTATVVGGWGAPGRYLPVGTSLGVEGSGVAVLVRGTASPARSEFFEGPPGSVAAAFFEVGARSGVGAPIMVEGLLWGVTIAASTGGGQPAADSEHRLAGFTELVATAIANAEVRGELWRVAAEQAALRRVATLVAENAERGAIFRTVIHEVAELSGADVARIERYESDGTVRGVAAWGRDGGDELAVGTRFALAGVSIAALVKEQRAPVRIDSFEGATGQIAAEARALGIRSSVGCPIVVASRLWGVIAASSRREEAFPPETESQIGEFTELVATAIANAEATGELAASRARIVAAADDTRRRIERDLHDGAQQRLVALALQLRAAQASVPAGLVDLQAELDRVAAGLGDALDELREYARGIHPAILAEGGLGPALRTLARRSAVPVVLTVRLGSRLPERIEVAAYYIVSEALANAAKHARATAVVVDVGADDVVLRLAVRDDGVGGADFAGGSGLVGAKDRVEALGGRILVESPAGAGTSISVELPIADGARSRSD